MSQSLPSRFGTEPRTFQYGTNTQCPVTVAGEDPDSLPHMEVAEAFDWAVEELGLDSPQSATLEEAEAKEAFLRGVEQLKTWADEPHTNTEQKHVTAAKRIGRTLGWIDPEN